MIDIGLSGLDPIRVVDSGDEEPTVHKPESKCGGRWPLLPHGTAIRLKDSEYCYECFGEDLTELDKAVIEGLICINNAVTYTAVRRELLNWGNYSKVEVARKIHFHCEFTEEGYIHKIDWKEMDETERRVDYLETKAEELGLKFNGDIK